MVHPDPQGKVVLSVQVVCSRNVRGIRMPPSSQLEDKVEVERLLVDAMLAAEALMKIYVRYTLVIQELYVT